MELRGEIGALDRAVAGLGLDLAGGDLVTQTPHSDARCDALVALIEELLRESDAWKDDERLIVFTEYKTTLDYQAAEKPSPDASHPW